MIFIDKMKTLKIYKRPMYLPTVEGDKKKGSAVLLLTPEYLSSRRLIQSDLLINKLRFQSYYLNPDVSYYINGQVAKGKQMSEYISEMDVIEMYHSLTEMTTEERNKIPDSKFGLPEKRKYPLDTSEHMRSAIRFFNYVDKEDEEELARNIIDRMGDFFDSGEMPKIGKNNRLSKYMNEAAKMPDNIPDDIKEFYHSLSDIKYGVISKGKVVTNLSSFDFFEDYKSLSISEIEKYRVGVCWDLVHYEAKWFKDHGYKYESYYIEVNDKDGDLPTHSFLVFYLPDSSKAYYFEKSWGKYAGIEEFSSIKNLTETVMQRHIDACNRPVIYGSEVINKYDASSASLEHITCVQYYKKASGGKTKLQESMITERSETIQQHIGNTSRNPELVNKGKEKNASGKAFHKGTHTFKRSPFGKAKLKQGGFQAKKEEKKQREEQVKAEATIFNDKDIFYNKDKFDSGEINLCFITGHSGSGKSTMAGNMEKVGVEKYELDDVISNKEHFTMADLKEYGGLIYEFFSGPGKKYYYTAEDVKSGKVKPYREEAYEHDLINDFIAYAIKYAKAHKDKKIVIEGVWLYGFAYKEQLTDYAVYIKGTSTLISTLRAAKRDSSDSKGIERVRGFVGRFMCIFGKGQTGPLNIKDSERMIQQWRDYFSSLPVSESSIGKDKTLYFLSTKNMDDERLQPRIPNSALIDNGSEDSTTKRICFCPSIDKCLMALSRNIAGQEFYVHVLDLSMIDKSYYKNLLHYPEKDEVPDAIVTREVWVLKPVTVECIGKIKVTRDNGKAYPYYYNGKKAELYGWNWDWIAQYGEAISLDEYYRRLDRSHSHYESFMPEAAITKATPMKSVLDSDFKANGNKSLSSFKKLPINKENINKYKSSYKHLSHVDSKDAGYIFIDGDKVVAIVAVDQSRGDSGDLADYNWISIIEVAKDYRGYGLVKQLLDIATGELKGDFLTVTYDNEIAIKTYKDYGFRITKNSYERIQNGTEKSHMYTMMYKNHGPKGIQLMEAATETEDGTLLNPTVVEKFGYKSKDGLYNAIVRLKETGSHLLFRGRSEMLVIKDHKEVFLAKNDDEKYPYRLPGGSWDENEDHMYAAIRETREEARIDSTNVMYGGSYAYSLPVPKKWVTKNIPEEYQWRGYYTEVFVADYAGSYNGKVDKEDQDKNMIKTGKFYPIDQVMDKLNPVQQQAIKKYLSEYNKQFKGGIKATHILASGIIRDKAGRMLLEWHNKANGLVLPSGKANPYEDPYRTLVRELHEELGIIVTDATLNERSSYQAEYPVGSGNWVIFDEYNYIVNSYTGVIENKEPEKHKELTWLSESEILDEGMNLTDELYNYLDYFLHGFTGATDDTLYDAIAQFIWFSGTTTDVEWAKRVFTPEFYYKFLNEIVPMPIYTTRDIPIINIKINPYYAGLDSYYECTTNEDGYIVITLHIPYYNEKRFDFEEYMKNMLYGFTTAYLFSMFPESTETVLAFIYADYLMGRNNSGYGDTYAWGKYLFGEKDGELPQMPIDEFLNCMKYGRVDKVYEVLADNFDLKYEDLIRDQYKDNDIEKSFDEVAYLPFSINKTKLAVGTVSDILTESNTIPMLDVSHLSEEAYIQIGDTITLFEASAQDARLRQLLYNERIKQRGQLLPILAQVKEDISEIKYAYPDIDRYKQKNLFVDLYYYNELFFRNNTWEKEKGYKLYLELLKRLINDPELKRAGYKKKTLFIPVLDWNLNKSSKMWMVRESINPISIIFNLMKMYPNDLKATFGKMDILFFGRDKYFKINFSEIEDPKAIAMKFSNFIRKLWQGEEFDPEDEDTSQDNGSPEQITVDLVDKIEDAKGVDLTKQVKKEEDHNKEIIKKIKKDGIYRPADEAISHSIRNREGQPTVAQKAIEDIENADDINLLKDVDKDKLQRQEDDLIHVALSITDVADAKDVEDALKRLDSDEEFKELLATISDIQDDSIKIDATRAARINKLDRDFLNSNVGGKTVKDILDSKETNKPLESTSFDIASPNEEWKNMTYINFDKDYDLNRDIVACFYHFTKTSKPISIRSLKTENNSTSEDRLILYTCEMEDFKGTRFTLKLDIPKMKGNRLRLRGNDKSIQNQLFNMPIIKTEPDTCQIVTNYQKIFIRTYNTVTGRSIPYAGRLIKAMKKYEGKKIKVIYGENAKICIKYEVPNDYLDLAGVFTTIETSEKIYYFNQDEIREKYPDIDDSKGMPYGYNKKTKTFLYYNMEYAPFSEMIAKDLCNADNSFRELYNETKPSTSGVYSQCSIMSTKIPLVIVCAYTEGLTKVLKKAGINYKLLEKLTPEDKEMVKDGFFSSIRFEDGYLLYETNYHSCMLLNGLDVSGCENYSMMEIDNRNTYLEMLDNYGGRIKSDGLDNFYDCLVDPISRETLEYYHLPTDFVGILLYANILLCDNKFIKHTDMSSRRVRRTEQIAAYAYEALAESYANYANMIKHSRSRASMVIKQSAVIDKILAAPISGDDSTINALEAAETTNAFSFRGKAGMNEQRSYTLDKRIYDISMVNVLGMSTSYSANVSITRQGTLNMNVDTARGYIKSINGNTDKMNAANTLAATEAVTPFGSTRDDAPRTLMTFAQTAQHTVITEESDPMLVTNGADEMLAYITTDKFAFKAKRDGKVIELTEEYMIIDYGDEKEYVNLSETIEKNSNGGIYTPLKLDVVDKIRVGSKVKENQIVAYNKKSFSNSIGESDNIAYNNGKLAKVAILNIDECFEDSGVCSQQFAEKMATRVIDKEDHILDKDSNIFKIMNVGDQVEPEDALMIWQNPHEEEEANTLLRILGNDQEMVSELGRRTVRSEITGRIADIRIYRTVEIEELSPSLQKIVKAYEKPIKERKKKLDELGIESDFLPPTYKLEPVGKLKKAQDAVLIEFYLERIDIISVGDKLTNYSANKAIIKNIIPAELMAYTDARPNEPIDLFIGQISIDKRMVTSTMNYGSIQKLLIEFDRWAKGILGIPFDDSKV